MQVTVSNTVNIENPTAEVLMWCKKNLTIPNPDFSKKARMHLWLGNTPRNLELYQIINGELVLPFGCLKSISPYLGDSFVERDCSPPVSVDYGKPIALYPYQAKAVEACLAGQYGILQSPAGSGKTEMAIALVKRWGKRTLFLTHTLDLLKQAKDRAIMRGIPQDLIGTITEGKVNIGSGITFATIQTMCRLDLAQYKDLWDVILVDECHRCSGTPTAMTQFFKVLNSLSARHKYGLSATVHRADGMIKATYALLGTIVYTVPDEAVGDRIMKVGIAPVFTGVKLSNECLNTDGTLNYSRLISYLCEDFQRNHLISSRIVAESEHPSLILSDRLEHLETLMSTLPRKMQEQAVMISGKMTSKKGKAEREQAIEDMRTGKKKYLFATYSLCKEGLDIPCLERLYMATSQKDYTVVVQSIGRIARVFPGKSKPVAYDFVDDIAFLHKMYKKRCTIYRSINCDW